MISNIFVLSRSWQLSGQNIHLPQHLQSFPSFFLVHRAKNRQLADIATRKYKRANDEGIGCKGKPEAFRTVGS